MTAELRPKLVGARVQRVEDRRLLTGRGSFTDDLRAADALHVALRRSDQPHARVGAIDTAAAAALPQVAGVFTAADIAGLVRPLRAVSRMRDYHATELPVLAGDVVRYVGEPIAAVVAASRYIAEDAAEIIELALEPLPFVCDPESAAATKAPRLHADLPSNVILSREFQTGNADAAFANAPVRVRGRYRMHRKTPVAIENRAYLAEYDARREALTLYSTTQVPGVIRDALAESLGLSGHRLRVVAADVGGGFGGKASLYPEEVLVCALALRLRRSVKWTSDRLEDLLATSQAFDEIVDAELALDEHGRMLALRAEVTGDVGAYSIYPWTAALEPVQVVSFLPGPYRIASYHGRVRGVATPKPPTGPYRGVGRPISTFAMERLIDTAARQMALDPVELRLRNLVRAEDFPYRTGSGIVWDRSSFVECLLGAREGIDYAGFRARQSAARAEGRWLGIGFASYAELTGIGSRISAAPGMPINTGTETASIRIDATGAVLGRFGVASHGQGLETTLAQIVADELGARMQDIAIEHGDSAIVAHSTGTYASRSAVLAGGAAILAARAVREKVRRAAAQLLEAAPEDIETGDGNVFVTGTDRSMTFRELARAVYSEMGRIPREQREVLEATELYDPYVGTATSATHVATVEVDAETFEIRVDRFLVVEDCGRVINPMIADGQVHGGVAQGIGAALLEEVVHDPGGQLLTASLVDYVVPSASSVPGIEVRHLETALPPTLGGFRGLGEGGTIGAPAAVANAVADALAPLGIAIDELPVSGERLFRLVSRARDAAARVGR